MESVTKF